MVTIEIGEDGRIVSPVGVRLSVPATWLIQDEPSLEPDEARKKRLERFWEESDAILASVPLKPWPKDDPIVEKFRKMGILDDLP